MDSVHALATQLYEDLEPNATLGTIEERVWMLKQRCLPDGHVREIIREEFVEHGQPTDDAAIIVRHLPEKYSRDDWC